jgi:hypothetical protein
MTLALNMGLLQITDHSHTKKIFITVSKFISLYQGDRKIKAVYCGISKGI